MSAGSTSSAAMAARLLVVLLSQLLKPVSAKMPSPLGRMPRAEGVPEPVPSPNTMP